MECRSPFNGSDSSGAGLSNGENLTLHSSAVAPIETRPSTAAAEGPARPEPNHLPAAPQQASKGRKHPGSLALDQFVRELLDRRLKQAHEQWRRCASAAGADEIHDLRVSLRRFGENLWLFRRLFGKRQRRQVRTELKMVMKLTAACRDADIAIESFQKAGVTPGLDSRVALDNARATAEAALVAALTIGLRTDFAGRWRQTLSLKAGGAARVVEAGTGDSRGAEIPVKPAEERQ